MKKITALISTIAIISIAVLGIVLSNQNVSGDEFETNNAGVTNQVPNNYTIQIYAEKLAGASEEEVNDYFSSSDDDTIIIADETGGYMANIDKSDTGYTEELDENMNVVARRYFNDKTQAATIAEVKEYLNSQRK
ncbi:hypothetical protein [Streptococcus marimammalium]|uniref:hypothetical protein n=1 Tax=Streptococcus marimammalium TaxID=269666 RepID=UPI00037E61E9|nr:hypothetical protein [Streptococcus marimammalium]